MHAHTYSRRTRIPLLLRRFFSGHLPRSPAISSFSSIFHQYCSSFDFNLSEHFVLSTNGWRSHNDGARAGAGVGAGAAASGTNKASTHPFRCITPLLSIRSFLFKYNKILLNFYTNHSILCSPSLCCFAILCPFSSTSSSASFSSLIRIIIRLRALALCRPAPACGVAHSSAAAPVSLSVCTLCVWQRSTVSVLCPRQEEMDINVHRAQALRTSKLQALHGTR